MSENEETTKKTLNGFIIQRQLESSRFFNSFLVKSETSSELHIIEEYKGDLLKDKDKEKKLLKIEYSLHRNFNSLNILKTKDFSKRDGCYYIGTEYFEGGSLQNAIDSSPQKRIPEKTAIFYLMQLVNAIKTLRQFKVYSRNFETDNIFIKKRAVDRIIVGKLGLFQNAMEKREADLFNCSLSYEILNKKKKESKSKADLWSLGYVFYQMLTGNPPFFGNDSIDFLEDIKDRTTHGLFFPDYVTKEAVDFISGLLKVDLKERLNWEEMIGHKLFCKYESNFLRILQSSYEDPEYALWTNIQLKINRTNPVNYVELCFEKYNENCPYGEETQDLKQAEEKLENEDFLLFLSDKLEILKRTIKTKISFRSFKGIEEVVQLVYNEIEFISKKLRDVEYLDETSVDICAIVNFKDKANKVIAEIQRITQILEVPLNCNFLVFERRQIGDSLIEDQTKKKMKESQKIKRSIPEGLFSKCVEVSCSLQG